MRRVVREQLETATAKSLRRKQSFIDEKKRNNDLNAAKEWDKARKTNAIIAVFSVLKRMMGQYERCMYCNDSHGTDIEHFWPKSAHPERMFLWANLLLCCAECGRFKGSQFPLLDDQPLLIDPTTEEPWSNLDFDPATGNIVARFDLTCNDFSRKGIQTVKVLQLDRREALAAGYRRTYLRLSKIVHSVLNGEVLPEDLPTALISADDHGLLGWCFIGTGKDTDPFKQLREQDAATWTSCLETLMPPETVD